MATRPSETLQKSVRPFILLDGLKRRRKDLFWAWIGYQTIKGTATTALIWVPALFYWFS